MKHLYFCLFILQTLGLWLTSAVASDDVATSTQSVDSSGDTVVGSWRIEFTPNRAIRLYEIRNDGTVMDAVGSIGRLITANLSFELGTGRSPEEHPATQDLVDWRHGRRWYLRFDQDTSGCFELITPTADGRLMVEHFNPSATELPRPDQIGIGERVFFRAAGAPLPTGTQSSITQPLTISEFPSRVYLLEQSMDLEILGFVIRRL